MKSKFDMDNMNHKMVRIDNLERVNRIWTQKNSCENTDFKKAIFSIDKSSKGTKIGSGCCKFQKGKADKYERVGREEEGTSSIRPEQSYLHG